MVSKNKKIKSSMTVEYALLEDIHNDYNNPRHNTYYKPPFSERNQPPPEIIIKPPVYQLLVDNCLLNKNDRLRVLNGKLIIEKRKKWLRFFTNDSRYKSFDFIINNEMSEKQQLIEHLKILYKDDQKFIKYIENKMIIPKN
jgi:hypothetical protein